MQSSSRNPTVIHIQRSQIPTAFSSRAKYSRRLDLKWKKVLHIFKQVLFCRGRKEGKEVVRNHEFEHAKVQSAEPVDQT